MVLTDSAFNICKSYYPQVFLEQYKNIVKEKRIRKYITDNQEISSGEKTSHEESSDKENYIEDQIKHGDRVSF